MKPLSIAIAAGLVLSFAAGRARACGSGYGNGGGTDYTGLVVLGGAIVAGVAAVDIAFTVRDLSKDTKPDAGWGALEVLTSAPQAVLFGMATAATAKSSNSGGGAVFLGALTVWTSLLTLHGLWSIGAAASVPSTPSTHIEIEEKNPPPPDPPAVELGLAPTYVDLGQRSSPGFGIVGRF